MSRTAQLVRSLLSILITTAGQGIQFLWLAVSSRAELSAEVLFLRKQLAFYQEHQVPPRKLTDAARFSLALWSQLFNWRAALVIVKPETLIGWHRQGFKLFWRWKSRLGRPRIPGNLRQLMVQWWTFVRNHAKAIVAADFLVAITAGFRVLYVFVVMEVGPAPFVAKPRSRASPNWPQERDPRGGRRTSSQQ